MGMIIGLTGQARAGKDTIAEYLVKNHGFVRIGLADPMKRFCQHLFDWNDEQVWGNKKEEGDPRYKRLDRNDDDIPLGMVPLSPRFALQTLGTEWGRLCCEDIWTIYGLRVAKELLAGYATYTAKNGLVITEKDVGICPGVVFSDLRFENEFDLVREAGGLLCRVKRPSLGESRVGIIGHASETEQKRVDDSEFDAIFHNDKEGDFISLYAQVEGFLKGKLPVWEEP